MADNKIHEVDPVDFTALKQKGLQWFVQGENHDYIADEFLEVGQKDLEQLNLVATNLQSLYWKALHKVVAESRWEELAIPAQAIPLLEYSIKNELEDYLVGRFDFAGGLGHLDPRLIEFNGDTCSLMPETAIIQEVYWQQEKDTIPGSPDNDLIGQLANRFEKILQNNPDKTPSLLLTCMGHEEDWLNTDVIAKAAKIAGFTDVQSINMDRIIFAPEEGVFIEMGEEDYRRYDFFFKMVPWDYILFEEPELFDLLDQIVQNDLCVVLNPAFSMLLQNKGLLKILHEIAPEESAVLKASYTKDDFPDFKFVQKPFFGRMGENIALFDGSPEAKASTDGDYENSPVVYQALAPFYTDMEGCRYQASIFWTGEPSGLCIRRQDHLIVSDDAEFLSHVIVED